MITNYFSYILKIVNDDTPLMEVIYIIDGSKP